jgi:hypothetical protein
MFEISGGKKNEVDTDSSNVFMEAMSISACEENACLTQVKWRWKISIVCEILGLKGCLGEDVTPV